MTATPFTRFRIGDAISFGWSVFWRNIGPMALFALIIFGVTVVFAIVTPSARDDPALAFVLGVLNLVVNQLIAMGWIKITLDIADRRPVTADAVLDAYRLFLPYVIGAFLYALMVGVGLVFLIVPGIVLALTFGQYGFVLIDRRSRDPIASLRRSAQITKGERWHLLRLGIVLFLLNLLGLLVLIVGVLVTAGISMLAAAYVFRQLDASAAPAQVDA